MNLHKTEFSVVEQAFIAESGINDMNAKMPYIVVEHFPKLGLLTALRFLEWAGENPEGVISLATGRTPEYFIKWTQFLLENWNKKKGADIRSKYGLRGRKAPDLRGLHFVQIDEFYPINPEQHNSFYNYVLEFYIKGFSLDIKKALLMNSEEIPLSEGKHYLEVFPGNYVDLSLRYREYKNSFEKMQQQSIFMIDKWCMDFETKIREKGGIGFFLGGIGPDGHIGMNTRGSDLFSTTRLKSTNFETQAMAASDLGGIETAKKRMVITIGLETITHNPETTAIIIASGEAKAGVVKNSLENEPTNLYPATVLQKLKNSRFYLTRGAASLLNDSRERYFRTGTWSMKKTEIAVMDLCREKDTYSFKLSPDDLNGDKYVSLIPGLNESTVQSVSDSIMQKILKGMENEENQVFLHTGPHHDDIMLGLLPHITQQLNSPTNSFHFAVMTSGFNAVNNNFVIDALQDTKKFLEEGKVQMVEYEDFFTTGYKFKWDKDVYHYLTKVAAGESKERRRGLSHRLVRAITDIYGVKSVEQLKGAINEILTVLMNSYDGQKNSPRIQQLKGMIREFEEELMWAHFGVQVKNVHHMRLGFYTGEVFTGEPEKERDVEPVYKLIKEIKPGVISLALDPEGSGPDTHYKALQTIAEAIRKLNSEDDLSALRIWGYRNIWHRFSAADANVIVPVTLHSMAVLDAAFRNCYLSQVDAPFPSYEYNGRFSDLARKIWVRQLKDVQLVLGKNCFYLNDHPRIRAAHGLLFFKEMKVNEFLRHARELEETMEG